MITRFLSLAALLLVSSAGLSADPEYNVRDYGAVGDGTTLDTAAIQSAVDAVSASGGGKLVFPPGTYLTSSIQVKNNVTLHFPKFSTLLGSPQWTGYQKTNFYALLLAEGQNNIGISGHGTINGNGVLLAADTLRLANEGVIPNANESYRPLIISFRNCTNVTVRDITLRDSAMWVQDYRQCTDLLIENITVRSNAVHNNDGLDLTDCHRAVVRGCDIDSEDDGICPKSSSSFGCEDILIENCRIRSSCNALKFGTASRGGFRNITVRNLEIYETYSSGIALEIVDGGTMENINISNVTITGTNNPLFIRLGDRSTTAPPGIVRGIHISNVTAEIPNRPGNPTSPYLDYWDHIDNELKTGLILGIPGARIQDVKLSDISFVYGGIGSTPGSGHVLLNNLTSVPEQIADYPDAHRFGTVPAWGLYIRHAQGIELENVTFRMKNGGTDYRAAVVCDDVLNLTLKRCNVLAAGSEAIIALHDVQGADIRNSVAPPGAVQFIRQMGATSGVVTDSASISWSGPAASAITPDSANISFDLLGTAAEVTLFWKQGTSAPEQPGGWDGSLTNPGVNVNPGPVTRTISGLLPDTTYSCIFHATHAAPSVAWSAPLTFSTAFGTAQVPVFDNPVFDSSGIQLSWQDNAATETGYILERSSSPSGPFVTCARLTANATSYVDSTILPFGSYYYRLAATNSGNGLSTDFAAAQTSVSFTTSASLTETFTTPGVVDWVCPQGVSRVTVECRAGGGAGGSAKNTAGSNQARAGGGAGGSYALKVNLLVIPGTTYKMIVGAGGVPVAAVTANDSTDPIQQGGDSKFTNQSMTTEHVRAIGGQGGRNVLKTSGSSAVNVTGGAAPIMGWTGDTFYPGGNGGNAGATSSGGTGAGGGGGGAGDAAPGGTQVFAIAAGTGGTARGANGPIASTAGFPGGGGGAVVADVGKENFGGAGAAGSVKLTYSINPVVDPYETWAGPGLDFDDDLNNDSVVNGLAWLLGASGPNVNATGMLPVAARTGGGLKLTFGMLPASVRGGTRLYLEYSFNLATWSTGVLVPDATGGTAPVTFNVTGIDPLAIEATVSSSEAVGGNLFSRLKAVRQVQP
jgi:Glycosyl hydrolases family 28